MSCPHSDDIDFVRTVKMMTVQTFDYVFKLNSPRLTQTFLELLKVPCMALLLFKLPTTQPETAELLRKAKDLVALLSKICDDLKY